MNDENERSVGSAGSVAGEPVAWSIQWHGETRPDGYWTYEDKNTAEICLAGCGSKGVVVPLYRQPTLTDAEREALERICEAADDIIDEDKRANGVYWQDDAAAVAVVRGLLERLGGGK